MIRHLCGSRRLSQPTISRLDQWQYRALKARVEIPAVLDDVLEQLLDLGYSQCDRFAVRVALEEAMVNAIQHGHRDDTSKTVLLRFCTADTFFLAQVEDEGPGFRPEEVPDPREEAEPKPGGRGLLLMKHYMTGIEYNAAGNCVTLCKHRSPAIRVPCQ